MTKEAKDNQPSIEELADISEEIFQTEALKILYKMSKHATLKQVAKEIRDLFDWSGSDEALVRKASTMMETNKAIKFLVRIGL